MSRENSWEEVAKMWCGWTPFLSIRVKTNLHICLIKSAFHVTVEQAPYLSELDFSNSPVWNVEFDELDFFPSLKPTGYFFQFKLIFLSSFMARVKYFDGPFLTIYSLSTIYRDIYYLWSGGFTTVTAMNRKDKNLGKSIFVHFDMTCLTTLTGIFDFANLIFQTWIL